MSFLATLSHELRNPLAPVRTAAQLLQSPGTLPQDAEKAKAIISRQVAHMSALLDDLLDVSRITRGSFLLKNAYIDLHALLEDAVEAVQPAIDKRQHTLRVEQPDEPVTLEGDPLRLTQVLTNLLTNAAKLTPPQGVITLGARLEKKGLILFVRDNGAGLAPDSLGGHRSHHSRLVRSNVIYLDGQIALGPVAGKPHRSSDFDASASE